MNELNTVLGLRKGKFFIAPANNSEDCYSAGFESNVFDTRADAESEIPKLQVLGAEWNVPWTVQQY